MMFCLVSVHVGCDVSNSLSSEDDFAFWVILSKLGVTSSLCTLPVVALLNLTAISASPTSMVRTISEALRKVCEWRAFCPLRPGMLFL